MKLVAYSHPLHLFVLLIYLLGGIPASSTVVQSSDLHLAPYLNRLAQEDPNELVRVIVQMQTPNSSAKEQTVQLGGKIIREFSFINGFVADLSARALYELGQRSDVRWISLDAPVYKMSESSNGTSQVRDDFSQFAYDTNSGSQNWLNNWQEIGESDGPQAGNVAITPFWGGALQGLRLQGANVGVERQASLANTEQAQLTIAYRRKDLTDNSYVTVAVSTDQGNTWHELGKVSGPGTDTGILYAHYDLSGYNSSMTTIRLSSSSQMGASSKFYIDYIALEYSPSDVIESSTNKVFLPWVGNNVGGFNATSTNDSSTLVEASAYSTATLASTYVKVIGADRVWTEGPSYLTGNNINIAVLDSGIADHPDLTNDEQLRIIAQVDFASGSPIPDDNYGHGTHVAGIIGGNGNQSNGKYMGVAPDVQFVDVKVTDDAGVGNTSNVVAGLQWVLNNKNTYNIRIVNLSLNSVVPDSYHASPLSAAVEILWFNSIVVVASAGNMGGGKLYPPANDPFIITVGSSDDNDTVTISDDKLSKFSAYNITEDGFVKPDLIAPGRNLVSLLSADDNNIASSHPENMASGSESAYYYKMSGTSMASAVTAGAIALLLQSEPSLTPDQVKYRLMNTAKPFSTGQSCATGAGYLDIYTAIHTNTTANANTGVPASRLLWTGANPVTWNSVNWNSVNWNSVNWNSVNWNSVNWNSVNWNSNSGNENASQYNCYDVDPTGLLGYWRLDETNGTIIADASGNNNVGSFNTAVNRQSSGKRNSAVALNGGVINIANATNLNTLTDQLTVSFWVKRTQDVPTWRALVSRQYGNSWGDQFTLGIENGYYTFGVNTVNNGHQNTWGGTSPLNEWVHFAGVYNGSQITHYLNGVKMDSLAVNGNLQVDSKPLFIGGNVNDADPNNAGDLFTGQVDDVRIYRRALSAAEILVLASGSMPAPQAPTVSLTAPTANATFYAPATISLTATASDSDGTISKVEFFNGATRLGEDTTAPYAFTWSNVATGSYALTAKATDNNGNTTTSVTVDVTVTPVPTFYRAINLNGNAITIDGRTWEKGTAANLSSGPNRFCNQTVPLTLATDSARATMLRCSIWGSSPVDAQVTVSAVPNATYQVYLYVWEDSSAETFSIKLNGATVYGSFNSGAAGTWRKLGPWTTTVTNGQIKLESSGGSANFSGVEIWRQ